MKHLIHFEKRIFQKIFPNLYASAYWINKYLKNNDLSIVQIGSNDGVMGDPLFRLINKNKKWKVLFVEPVPYLFEKLKHNYKISSRFIFENVAINDGACQVFYSVKEDVNDKIPNLPIWIQGLGSFYKENITKHLNGILKSYIVETKIKGITLKELFERNRIDSIDLLHIDAEGYDWKVLSQLNLKKYSPTLILFEYNHLEEFERLEALMFLKDNYNIFILGNDCLCIRKDKVKKKDLFYFRKTFIEDSR